MCGRFVVARTVGEIQTIFEADEVIGDVPGVSFNVAPTQPIAIIVDRAFEKAPDGSPLGELSREIHAARWGLVQLHSSTVASRVCLRSHPSKTLWFVDAA
jgi:putative SOS response-associated peptidase YedK